MQPAASGNSDGEAKSAASDDEGASSPRKKAPKPTKKAILKYADPKSKVSSLAIHPVASIEPRGFKEVPSHILHGSTGMCHRHLAGVGQHGGATGMA